MTACMPASQPSFAKSSSDDACVKGAACHSRKTKRHLLRDAFSNLNALRALLRLNTLGIDDERAFGEYDVAIEIMRNGRCPVVRDAVRAK